MGVGIITRVSRVLQGGFDEVSIECFRPLLLQGRTTRNVRPTMRP